MSSFIERNITGLAETLERAALADTIARRGGWLQALDPRAKIIGFALLIIAAVTVRHLAAVTAVLLMAVTVALTSRIELKLLVTQVWLGVLAFTGLIALPAVLLMPGDALAVMPGWHLPVTAQGLHTAGLLLCRAETTATLAFTLVLSTRWTHVLKALRVLGVPTVAVVILGMTHRYIFLLLRVAEDFFVARRSRLVGTLDASQRRTVAAGAAGVLLGKSLQLGGEVHQAMQSRGFRGEVHALDDFHWKTRDSFALAAFAAVAASTFWFGWK